jgi:DNA-binding CsgD family transcriptional regulator
VLAGRSGPLERALGSGPLVATVYDGCEGDTSDPVHIAFKGAAPPGVLDYLTINARAPDRTGVIVGALLDRLTSLDVADVRLMTRVGVHFTAGYRLRRALAHADLGEIDDRAEAVLTPGGKVEHATGPAQSRTARQALRDRAVAIDRARSRRGGRSDDALELWKGLVSGRWSLVDRFDSDGRRYVVALRNDPAVTHPRALTLRERQSGGLAGMGYPNKLIAYALGVSPSNVSATLRNVLRKLGLRHRSELAMLSAVGTRASSLDSSAP